MLIGKLSLITVSFAAFFTSQSVFATGGAHGVDLEPKALEPATRYSGSSPIDTKNGIPFNNGTFGLPNPVYEKWAAAPIIVPGNVDLPYPYSWKSNFIRELEENIRFAETAIRNWKTVTENTKPEAQEYAQKAIASLEPQLQRLKEATRAAASASQSNWDKAQADARQALIDMRLTYSSLHHNIR